MSVLLGFCFELGFGGQEAAKIYPTVYVITLCYFCSNFFWIGQDSTVQDRTGQDRTVQYSTVQYSTVQYSTVQYRTGQDRTGQDRTGQDRTVQDRTGSAGNVPDVRCMCRCTEPLGYHTSLRKTNE